MLTNDFNYLVGKPLDESIKSIPEPFFIFVMEKDGENFYRSQELNKHRINVKVRKDYIYKVDGVN